MNAGKENMIIQRNGKEYALTAEELRLAAEEFNRDNIVQDIVNEAKEMQAWFVDENKALTLVPRVEQAIEKNEEIGELSLNCVRNVLKEFVSSKRKDLDWSSVEEKLIISIEENEFHEKEVHFLGYGYESVDDVSDDCFRFLEYSGFIVPIDTVLENGGVVKYEIEELQYQKEYVTDCSKEKCVEIYQLYDNGATPKFIDDTEITRDTPCGVYIVNDDKK